MMLNELDKQRTLTFVEKNWHGLDPDGLQARADLAVQAEQMCERWFMEERSFLTPAMRATIEGVWHASILAGALDRHGLRHEDIVELVNLEVADMLACTTPDNRLPQPRRILMHVSDLGQAPRPAQILRAVQLGAELREASDHFVANPERERARLKDWLPEVDRYVDALWRLDAHPALEPEWPEIRDTCQNLVRAVDKWRQREHFLEKLKERLPTLPAPKKGKSARSARSLRRPGGG